MAGGKGTRLRPLTCAKPKPMVLLANNPVMTHTIELLKKQGFTDIGVTVQHLASQIMDYYGDGREYGVNLQYFVEDMPLGTAGSVKNAQDFLDETFLVISGDGLTDIDLSQALQFHRAKKSLATLILSSVDNPLEYGIVVTKKTGEIVRFLEKPSWSEVFSDQVNTGMYILEPEVLNFIPDKTFFDFSKNLFPLLMAKGYTLNGFSGKGYWCDIGNSQAYLQAHVDILMDKVSTFLPYKEYKPKIWVGNNTEINSTAKLEAPLVIGHNCHIGPEACLGAYSFIADNCKINDRASIKRSVLWNGVTVGKGTALRGAALCSNVHVKSNTSIYEGVIIGNETVVQKNCTIKPGAKIWPGKTIEEGTIFKDNLVWGVKFSRNLFGFNGIKGEFNVDISSEQILRLGSAFGSIINAAGKVGISSDEFPISQTLKQVLSSGLQVVGQQVYDLGDITVPMTRFAINNGNLQGGIHVQFSEQENTIQILFFNEEGANISKAQEKKMESILAIDDFHFVSGEKVKSIVSLADIYELYFLNLKRQIKENISLKLVFSCPSRKLSRSIIELLSEISCQVEEVEFDEIKKTMSLKGADLGVYLDSHGEKLILFDEKGNILEGDQLKVLLAYLLFKEIRSSTLVAPIDAPSVLEELAEECQGKVLRTKQALQARMENMLKQGEFGQKQFYLEFDGLQAVLEILKTLINKKTKLSQLISELPVFYLHRESIDCPWEIKGKIIRSLMENFNQEDYSDSIEGVKFKHPKGWTLILPDSEKPLVKIISESSSMEIAQEITNIYKDKIQQIMGM